MPDFFYPPVLYMRIRDGKVNNTFGMVRTDSNGNPKPHQGWDLEAIMGTHVIAIADGTIVWTRSGGDYGNQVLLKFAASDSLTRYAFYAHLSLPFIVWNGKEVEQGELIAMSGDTGNAAGTPHLHFEIRDTEAMDLGMGLIHRIDPKEILGGPPFVAQNLPGKWLGSGYVAYGAPSPT